MDTLQKMVKDNPDETLPTELLTKNRFFKSLRGGGWGIWSIKMTTLSR